MPLLGKGTVAMWWTIAADQRDEFGDWHSHEHFPERMSIPGFRRGSRWANVEGNGDFFVLYELEDYEVLTSPAYLERLNDPTPWSVKMMPHHLGMVRSQARVVASYGGGIPGSIATIRFSPPQDARPDVQTRLTEELSRLPNRAGLTGAHLLRTETPPVRQPTKEQTIRGGDAAADWIILLSGYDPARLRAATERDLFRPHLSGTATVGPVDIDYFNLDFSMATSDLDSAPR